MILGTHNSATGGELLWWLRPLAWVINPTSKCQDRTIQEQLSDGVKLFNLQVAHIGYRWRFSHGLALYKENVFDTLLMLREQATKDNPIYIQLYLDKCFWCRQDKGEFERLVRYVKECCCHDGFYLLPPWIEGTNITYDGSKCKLSWEERYWSKGWSKGKSWIDKLPLPKRHAEKYNAKYKSECKNEYLMLDYYEH